ncbi:MAG: preprotein translocase subunit SecG [Desulfovibrio sp.]|nr:MAG: preprotein translocase subunit SecG [Desulfovibrio sp.]
MHTFILTLHIIVCLFLIVLVLLQAGKEGMGVIFGGGSSSLFGSSGAGGLLVKVTAACAALFLFTSLTYAYLTNNQPETESVMEGMETSAPVEEQAPLDLPPTGEDQAADEDAGQEGSE